MKVKGIVLTAISMLAFGGCATPEEKTYSTPIAGMSRNFLRSYFGEPVRIELGAGGGEDWYYRFSSWKSQPTGSTSTTEEFGQRTSSVSAGVEFSKEVVELPVHLSADGIVLPPLPKGKVERN